MNVKLFIGVIIPSIIATVLITLSSFDIGFSVEKKNINSVHFYSLFVSQNQKQSNVPVQTINITNSFLFSKRFELPKLIACLNDKEGIKPREYLQVIYSEGSYSSGSEIPIFEEIFYDPYDYSSTQVVEISTSDKKQIHALIQPKIIYDYSYNNDNYYQQTIESYSQYDEILLIESMQDTRYLYNYCQNLESKELDSAVHINITGKEGIKITVNFPGGQQIPCVDSDAKDHYNKGNATGFQPSFGADICGLAGPGCYPRNDGVNYTSRYDYCVNEFQLEEAYCRDDGRLASESFDCTDGCKDGVCLRIPKCEDSDSQNPFVKGTVIFSQGESKSYFSDECNFMDNPPNTYVREVWCDSPSSIPNAGRQWANGLISSDGIMCHVGCSEGYEIAVFSKPIKCENGCNGFFGVCKSSNQTQ